MDKGNPSALKFQKNDRSAIVYNGLVIGVQSRHPIRDRPASLEAESLARVYNNEEWCELLEKHGIDPEPKSVISVWLFWFLCGNEVYTDSFFRRIVLKVLPDRYFTIL
ncbi:hypothetical protein [Microcystis aeruginosa]|uniref:hypothetical protein n=1 Tax=Microcystis aeruginosa TaxID=1126 RepID=UPI0012DA7D89|nr:hypothetical protein [Microcystis aeruginosa]